MYRFSLKCLCLIFISNAFAATPIMLEKAPIHAHDKNSIMRGAKFFAANCMVCHSLKYAKDNSLVLKAGIDYQKMPVNAQEWWKDHPPPDLSLIAQARGINWLYTYLHSFYQDNSRPSLNNNLLLDNTNMPNPFLGMQGTQVLIINKKALLTGEYAKKPRWFEALKLEKQGSMTPEEFDKTMTDLVNFLSYTSDPHRMYREKLGIFVLGFLALFILLCWLLKKSYWRNLYRKKK